MADVSLRAITNKGRVLESLKAGKRLPEARFASLKIARSAQESVHATFAKSARGGV